METTQEFGKALNEVNNLFHKKIPAVEKYTAKVKKLCSVALDASLPIIRHTPITSRIKSWKSAEGSICRRYNENLEKTRLRDCMEQRCSAYFNHSQERELGGLADHTTSSLDPQELLTTLHDFGGIRISLYLPGDIERAAEIIKKNFLVMRRKDKGDEPVVDMQTLKCRLGLSRDAEEFNQAITASNGLKRPVRTFNGYKATHFIVRLRDEDIEANYEIAWKDVVVEIKVGTLVMHVWSEIEHDMIYKQLGSEGGGVSEDEERILDLINGIVLTGEAALRQLEASTAKRLNLRAKDTEMTACSHYEIATWIERDCKELNIHLEGDAEWALLDQLFTILKATGHHRHADVTGLIKSAAQKSSSRHSLPAKMLKLLSQKKLHSEWQPLTTDGHRSLLKNARLWALRLVHSLNLAIYLGVAQNFITEIPLPFRLSITAFLDILHPYQPRCLDAGIAYSITIFCQAILEEDIGLKSTLSELVQVARALPARNLVTSLPGTEDSVVVPVPALLYRLLIADTVKENGYIDDIHRSLDIMDFIIARSGKKCETSSNMDRLFGLEGDSEDRYFVPTEIAGDMAKSRWQLSKDSLRLMIQSVNINDTHKFALLPDVGKVNPKCDLVEDNGSSNSVLNLAYHLYPEEQWNDVYTAWNVVKQLQLDRREETPRNDDRSVINEALLASLRQHAGVRWHESFKQDTKVDMDTDTKGEIQRFPSKASDARNVLSDIIARGPQPTGSQSLSGSVDLPSSKTARSSQARGILASISDFWLLRS